MSFVVIEFKNPVHCIIMLILIYNHFSNVVSGDMNENSSLKHSATLVFFWSPGGYTWCCFHGGKMIYVVLNMVQ